MAETNIFKNGQLKAEQTQKSNKASATGKSPEKPERKTVRINISLSEETHKKFCDYASKTGISKSAMVQMWINQNCN